MIFVLKILAAFMLSDYIVLIMKIAFSYCRPSKIK